MAAPRSVEIAGPLKALEFPPVCANCGNATSESLDVPKVFHRISDDDSPNRFYVEHVRVPFCPPCAAQHQSELPAITASRRLLLACRGNSALGVLAFGLLTLLLLYMFWRRPSPIFLGVAAVLAFFGWVSYREAFRQTEHLAVAPPTSVSSAFDFREDRSGTFERAHRTIVLRNPVFADAFIARNAERIWRPDDPANQSGGWMGRLFR